MRLLHALVAFGLAACTPGPEGVTKILRANNEVWFVAKCGPMSLCYDRASEVCPGGYKEDQAASRAHEVVFTCTKGNVNWK